MQDFDEKAMKEREIKLENQLVRALVENNNKVEHLFYELIGSRAFTGLVKRNDSVYVITLDNAEYEVSEFYAICGTDMTYEDYLETLIEFCDESMFD